MATDDLCSQAPLLLHPLQYFSQRWRPSARGSARRPLRWVAVPLAFTALGAAEEIRADIPAEVTLQWGQPCDAQNGRLYIENSHSFRTAIVTVRWKAAGGKALEEKFVLEPGVITEIGCALAGATIVKAELAEF